MSVTHRTVARSRRQLAPLSIFLAAVASMAALTGASVVAVAQDADPAVGNLVGLAGSELLERVEQSLADSRTVVDLLAAADSAIGTDEDSFLAETEAAEVAIEALERSAIQAMLAFESAASTGALQKFAASKTLPKRLSQARRRARSTLRTVQLLRRVSSNQIRQRLVQIARRTLATNRVAVLEAGSLLHGAPPPATLRELSLDDVSFRLGLVLDFDARLVRNSLEKGLCLTADAKDARARVATARVPNDRTAASPSKRARVRKNRYLSFRAKRKKVEDGSIVLDMGREWRGPFEFGYTGGVFRDDPDPLLYRGTTFVGMEVQRQGAPTLEFFSANARYLSQDDAGNSTGVQVFAASHTGNHGSRFFPGVERVDVKVVYENDTFEMFAKPAGAGASAFLSVGTFEPGPLPGAVWIGSLGANNLAGKTEMGIDDVFARALGGDDDGGEGGGGEGGGPVVGTSASALVDGVAFVPVTIRVDYNSLLKRLKITLTDANGDDILLTSQDDIDGPGTFVPTRFGTSFLESVGGSFREAYALVEGTGEITVDFLDFAANPDQVRGTFRFQARNSRGVTVEITNGTFETDDG